MLSMSCVSSIVSVIEEHRLISHTTKSVTDLKVAILGVHDPSFSEVISKKINH